MAALLKRRPNLVKKAAGRSNAAEKVNLLKRKQPTDAAKVPPDSRSRLNNSPNSAAYLNDTQQMDILELPNDTSPEAVKQFGWHGAKYLLVVVDLFTRHVAAQPMADKSSRSVRLALEKIYRAGPLKAPNKLEVDSGSEFEGELSSAFRRMQGPNGKPPFIRYGRPGRSRQQSIAENANQMLGDAITELQQIREKKTGETDREWVEDLPELVKALDEAWTRSSRSMNVQSGKRDRIVERAMAAPKAGQSTKAALIDAGPSCDPKAEDEAAMSCKILPIGTKVLVKVEKSRPVDVFGNKENNSKRSGDPIFNPEVREITNILVTPGQAVRYRVSPSKKSPKTKQPLTAFRRDELRVVPDSLVK
jgi:transposase InsO family protein